jgi:hypothetical protein
MEDKKEEFYKRFTTLHMSLENILVRPSYIFRDTDPTLLWQWIESSFEPKKDE